jgi:hypothetical protein
MITVAAAFIVLAILLGYRHLRRRWMLSLAWPRSIGLGQLTTLVHTYLKHHGWTIETLPIAQHMMLVRKERQSIRLMCLPSLVQYDGSKIRDLSQMARGPVQLVCITTGEVPRHQRSAAAAGRVLLLHYKHLDMFADLNLDQASLLNTMREELLERPGKSG